MPGGGTIRNAFLKQQFRSLDKRFGMKTLLHNIGVNQIIKRDHDHSLMMCHEGGDHDFFFTGRQTYGRIVDRFVKSETG